MQNIAKWKYQSASSNKSTSDQGTYWRLSENSNSAGGTSYKMLPSFASKDITGDTDLRIFENQWESHEQTAANKQGKTMLQKAWIQQPPTTSQRMSNENQSKSKGKKRSNQVGLSRILIKPNVEEHHMDPVAKMDWNLSLAHNFWCSAFSLVPAQSPNRHWHPKS